jgi:hypothetical protein
MDGADQLKLWAQFPALLGLIYLPGETDEEYERLGRAVEFENIAGQFRDIFISLNRLADFAEPDIRELQLQMDQFSKEFCEAFSRHDVTNYVHVLQSGDVRFFLRRFKSLFRQGNIGLESCVKVRFLFL